MNKTLATVLVVAVFGLLGYAVYQSLYYSQTEEIAHEQLADSVTIPESQDTLSVTGAVADELGEDVAQAVTELDTIEQEEQLIDEALAELTELDF